MKALLALTALCLLLPAAAGAASVRVEAGEVVFQGAPGEANDVTVDPWSGRISDAGAPIDAGAGCRPGTEPGKAECDWFQRGRFSLGDGNDRIAFENASGGPPSFDVEGGDGADAVAATTAVRRVDGGPGPDKLSTVSLGYGYGGGELYGGEGDDELTSSGGVADGGPGNDTISATGGASGGAGDDRIAITSLPGYGPAGPSFVLLPGAPPLSVACTRSPGPLVSPGADGGPGDDSLSGSEGMEALAGGDGNDRIDGGDGYDRLAGDGGDDAVEGGPGTDELSGGDGTDVLAGGDGDDSLDGGAGGDTIGGGGGFDEACYARRTEGVTVDLRTPGGDGEPGENDSIGADVERIGGTDRDDTIVAGDTGVQAGGGGGDDTLRGGPGPDSLDGGPGDDALTGGAGDDQLNGGETRRSTGNVGDDTIDGGPGDDLLTGSAGNDWLSGGPGRDGLSGHERGGWVGGAIGAPLFPGGAINHSPIVSMAHEDQIWCGGGVDRVSAEFADAVAADCEEAFEGAGQWKRRALTSAGRVKLKARCAWDTGRACKGFVRVLAAVNPRGGTVPASASSAFGGGTPSWCKPLVRRVPALARVRFDVRAGRVGLLEAALTRRGRTLVARRGCVPVRVALEFKDADGRPYGSSRAISLTRKGFRP